MDNNKLLSFLRECIKNWKRKGFIQDNEENAFITTMLNQAEALVKEHRLLHQYIISIKTPATIDKSTINYIIKSIQHNLTGYGAVITKASCLIPDNRVIEIAPELCRKPKVCKWLRNNECWHEETYYGRDFPLDCECND